MASRQRSFFDQDRKKARTNFNRARSVNDAYSKPMTTGPSKPAGNAMPIAPASQTKRKLKNFQFIPGGPAGEAGLPEDADKENMNPSDDPPKRGKVDYTKRTRLDEPVEHPVDRQPAAVTRISSQPNNALFPSTPVPRLPLSDLVGQDGDDDLTEDRDDSPEEHVQWKHHTPARSRGKKRARSSSPLSSHLDTIQEHSSFDMQRLSHTLKTPQADPAADLLSRYGINLESMVTPDTAGNVAHAEAPHPGSSPRSSSQGGNVNGLRRWLSCGNQFPESRSPKRRRVADPSRDVLDRLVESPSRAALAHVEMHRNQRQKTEIETLIGKITDLSNVRYELQKPPSSSGPLPETRVPEVEAEHGNRISNTAPEPARTKDRCPFSSQETLAGEADPAPQLFDGPNPPLPKNVQMTPVRRNSPKQPTSSSTDYGSLDLDSDDYDILDAITAHSTQAAIAGSRSQLSTAPAGSQTNSRMNTAAVKSASPPLANGEPTRTDDDYDFDDDLDLDDLVPVADFVQTKPFLQTQQPLPLPTVQVQTVYQETRAAKPNTLNEDEYGDFDDVDFDDLVPLDQVDVQGASAKNQQPAAGSVASSE
ncbi:hypothetical protein P152DRAFT_265647 [Eremomyces bilateralis CBS 781.70]|uniref:Uncharacterized protein n=1 Tax=Eremomyces bilateralis CBS 781.70 TaxID=1392243 RepID=A0A6G1G8L3_9PEZI|nr:uncharacterized protein P152DRAFT_265647 [Eremomyces bilateralis CBS 781.70]KAF1814261.1 hypothetical protein P152DRAFT_265647 [Eremomyces bilateralis CBS 781.70]